MKSTFRSWRSFSEIPHALPSIQPRRRVTHCITSNHPIFRLTTISRRFDHNAPNATRPSFAAKPPVIHVAATKAPSPPPSNAENVVAEEPDAELEAKEKADEEEFEREAHPYIRSGLTKAVLFTLTIGGVSFSAANYLASGETEKLKKLLNDPNPSQTKLQTAQRQLELEKARRRCQWLADRVPVPVTKIAIGIYEHWLNLDDGGRLGYGIIAANAVVFAAWQIPALGVRMFMVNNFRHHPLSGKTYTMLTSTFSHSALWHFALNMISMQSFLHASSGFIAQQDGLLGPMPTSSYHTLAFYLTAGVFASLGSQTLTAVNLLRKLGTPAFLPAVRGVRAALGASGAIYGLVTLTACSYPDSKILAFFAIPLPIILGVGGLVTLDVVGLVRGWQTFAHEAHLAGAVFGAGFWAFTQSDYAKGIAARRKRERDWNRSAGKGGWW